VGGTFGLMIVIGMIQVYHLNINEGAESFSLNP
jgi:hypothetical protein